MSQAMQLHSTLVWLSLSLPSWICCHGVHRDEFLRLPKLPSTYSQYHRKPAHPSIVNCTWRTFEQKLDHFGDAPGTFQQRYCLYSGYWKSPGPIFFYTGNESPVEVYVNNTGLMWEMGQRRGALLVFAEHRYEPGSHPRLDTGQQCFAYCTTAQALADYVAIIASIREEFHAAQSPVIAVGGSYGGMLAGWFRIKYPKIVAGSIAASAPVWGLPTTMTTEKLDWSAQAISRGVSSFGGASDRCLFNLRSAWPAITELSRTPTGLALLGDAAQVCSPLTSGKSLVSWAQAPWFTMAEGNYPFPSTYITYSVGPGYFPLPAWPMQKACSFLDKDFGVKLNGSLVDVRYSFQMGALSVDVDWDQAIGNGDSLTSKQIVESGALELVTAVKDAVAIWYNVSKDKTCFDIAQDSKRDVFHALPATSCPACPVCAECPPCPVSRCEVKPTNCSFQGSIAKTFAWTGVTSNDDLNLINTNVQGIGRDMFWPPNVKQNTTVTSLVGPHVLRPGPSSSFDSMGLLGAPSLSDPWSEWLTAYYGGLNISHHRNIIWSNGALDPWSGAGVYPPSGGPEGPLMQNISDDGTQIALVIDMGGHHLDLFFADANDPPSVRQARIIEEEMVIKWSQEWYAESEYLESFEI